MGDDIGWFNVSAYNMGIMGYRTPNIDRIGKEGAVFTDWYGQQSCTAGRAAFITGQSPIRTGLTKVGLPGAELGLGPIDPSVADVMKSLGYATGQFGKNHLGDRNEHLADGARLRRVFRQPLPPQRRGGAGEPRLSEGPGIPEEVWTARGQCKDRQPMTDRQSASSHREHRPARHQAHGDDRRGVPRRGEGLHQAQERRRQAVVLLLQLNAHARLHASEEGIQGKTGLGLYPDGMVETDGHVGQLLKLLDDLGVADNTIVVYTTDNGAEVLRGLTAAPRRSRARRRPTGKARSAFLA